MILAHDQVSTEWYFFFSLGWNDAGKNEFEFVYLFAVSFYVKYKNENIINNQ